MKRLLITPIFYLLSNFLFGQTNVRAWQADGQVWIVWEFDQNAPARFSIFQSPTQSAQAGDWEHIGSLFPEHCVPFPIRTHLGVPNQTWKIPDGNGGTYQLEQNEGLFVKTIHNDDANHYSVLPCALDACPETIDPGNVSKILNESFDSAIYIRPHLQNELSFGDRQKALVYSFWVDGKHDQTGGLDGFPIMGNQYTNGWPQYFAIWTGVNTDLSKPSPAINWLHGGSGNFSQYLPGKRAEINIEPDRGIVIVHNDDFYRYLMGRKVLNESNSWWFGWTKDHNPFQTDHAGPTGADTIINYTQRKIKWVNDWLVNENVIDSNKIAIQGYSLGSAGAFGMMKSYPDFFSIGTLFNCGQQGPDLSSFGPFILGTEEQNLPTNILDKTGKTLHIYDLYGFEKFTTHSDLPQINAWHGKNDINPTMGWDVELLQSIYLAKSKGIHYNFYWDERAHPIQDIMTHWSMGPNDEEQTAKDDTKAHEKYRNDQSYPVFYNYRSYDIHHSDPGNGMSGTGDDNGDDWGSLGGYHEYDVSSVTDYVESWSCYYFLTGANARAIDRYMGPENCIMSDFTIRRNQNFKLAPLEPFEWTVTNESGEVLVGGSGIADQEGRAVLEGITACRDPQRLKIELRRLSGQGCDQISELTTQPGIYCQAIEVNDRSRDFLTVVPEGYDDDEPYGLLLAFHGGGGNFKNFAFGHINDNGGGREEFHQRAAEEKIILVYPQALLHPDIQAATWNTFEYAEQTSSYADDYQFVIELLELHASELKIDNERIYAAGYSRGGDFAQLIGRRLSCYFAGVCSVGSSSGVTHTLGSPDIQFYPKGEDPVSVLMIKGDKDFKRPWLGGLNNNNNLVPSGIEDINQWVQNNGCDAQRTETFVVTPNILTDYRNADCNENRVVKMLQGHMLAHVWPDEDDDMGVNANREFIEFLKDLRNPNSCLTTGVGNPSLFKAVDVFPNPTFDEIRFEMEEINLLQIFDVHGIEVFSYERAKSGVCRSVDVSALHAGCYTMRIVSDGDIYVGSFIRL